MRRLWICLFVVALLWVPSWAPQRLMSGRAVVQQVGTFFVPRLLAASAVVQSCANDSGGSPSCSMMSNVTSTNALVIFCGSDGSGAAQAGGDGTNSYTEDADDSVGSPSIEVSHALNVTGGALTLACSGASFQSVIAVELSGIGAYDGASAINSGTSAAAANTAFSLSATGIVLSSFNLRTGGTISVNNTGTSPATWTEIKEQEGYTNTAYSSAYKTGAAASYTHVWTNPSGAWKSVAIGLTDSGGGGATCPKTFSLLGVGC